MSENSMVNTFWFENPDAEITIAEGGIPTKIRRLVMESIMDMDTKKRIWCDTILTNYTGDYVCYFRRADLRNFIVSFNRKYKMNVDANSTVIKVHTDSGNFIFASLTKKIYRGRDDSSLDNSLQAQLDYFIKHRTKTNRKMLIIYPLQHSSIPMIKDLCEIYGHANV